MSSLTLAFVGPQLIPFLMLFLLYGFWLFLIILAVLYVVHSIKQRRRILTQLEQLKKEVSSLRQDLDKVK
jgi:heme exporter protein D